LVVLEVLACLRAARKYSDVLPMGNNRSAARSSQRRSCFS
jgi:hypothetical protein